MEYVLRNTVLNKLIPVQIWQLAVLESLVVLFSFLLVRNTIPSPTPRIQSVLPGFLFKSSLFSRLPAISYINRNLLPSECLEHFVSAQQNHDFLKLQGNEGFQKTEFPGYWTGYHFGHENIFQSNSFGQKNFELN